MTKQHNTIWYYLTLLCLLLSVSMPLSVADQGIIIVNPDPPSFTVNLTGGDTVIKYITVRWTGSDTVSCNISTDITSDCPENDSEGIYVTYSKNLTFTLEPGINSVEMTIKAALDIMPCVYTITTTFSCEYEEPEPTSGNGGNGGWSPPSPYKAPIADASAGELYTGAPGEEITFDGSLSYDDPDGYIVSYIWSFGDETIGTGETTTHSYSDPGTYKVTLTVKDNQGYTNTYETVAIIKTINMPPFNPEIDGPRNGTKNTNYTYTAVSSDLDGDIIRYLFTWGDGTNMTTTGFLSNGTVQTHFWTAWGIYVVSVKAHDNKTYSGTTEYVVLIDVLYVKDVGYLIDVNADGIYDLFYSNETMNKTTVEKLENGTYLLDSDDDTLWNYEYNPETNTLSPYIPMEEEKDIIPWYVLVPIILVTAICVTGFVYLIRRVKNKKRGNISKKKNK